MIAVPSVLFSAWMLLAVALASQQVHAWWLGPDTAVAQPVGPIKARALIDLDGVKGSFVFSQASPQEPTRVEYDLEGLRDNNRFFHVHVRPVPAFDANLVRNNASAIEALCGDPATGGHHNPHHITQKLPPKSAPFDQYEIGDLSGKHGALIKLPGAGDRYKGSFVDDKLPLSGEHSILHRSVVIHKNDKKRWVCGSIVQV